MTFAFRPAAALLAALAALPAAALASAPSADSATYPISAILEPESSGRSVVVNIPQRKIFLFEDGKLSAAFDAGVGKPSSQTPRGYWAISEKRPKPAWYVPASIQAEMGRKGRAVQTVVPPGPKNPLGVYFMKLGQTSIGIHGTSSPSSVPGWVSHGCIRMRNDDVLTLSGKLSVGDSVRVAYEPVTFRRDPDGAVWMAAHPDPYSKGSAKLSDALDSAAKIAAGSVDEAAVKAALAARDGKPRLVFAASASTPAPAPQASDASTTASALAQASDASDAAAAR